MFLIFFTFFLFASGIFVNKILLGILPPTLFVGIRMFSAGLILLAYTAHKYRANFSNIKQDWFILTSVAIFTTFLPAILKAYALSHLQAAHASLLGSVDPFVTALYAYFLWGERLSTTKVVGIAVGCIGVISSLNLSSIGAQACASLLLPQCAALAAIMLSRLGWTMVQIQLRKNRYPPSQLNSIVMIESGIIALVMASWLDPVKILVIHAPWQFILLMTYTVVVGNVVAYTLYGGILKRTNATLVSLAGFSIPVFVEIFSFVFLGTAVTYSFLLSGTIIFSGLLIFYYDELKSQKNLLL